MRRVATVATALVFATSLLAQDRQREQWNTPQAPFRVFGNTHYVGPRGVGSVLITGDGGHMLIDGGLPESVRSIVDNIRRLGFRIEDVRLIVNSHVHYDHAGGIAELQRLSGATVAARESSAHVFRTGRSDRDDPQFGVLPEIAPVEKLREVKDGEAIRVGTLTLTAHATPGHTTGGTSWTWRSCEGARCLDLVYGDSLNAVSADGFLFTASKDYPDALRDFEASFRFMSSVPCDILLSAHPDASELWTRLARRDQGEADALVDRAACGRYADAARTRLNSRIEAERKAASR
jgi:metallo-beta-lactamase class B